MKKHKHGEDNEMQICGVQARRSALRQPFEAGELVDVTLTIQLR